MPTPRRLLDAGYDVLARGGAKAFTVRAVEDGAGLPHGSVRHHFGTQSGLLGALVEDLVADDLRRATLGAEPAELFARMLGPNRTRTVARYELFLMAGRDETLRARLVTARDALVSRMVTIGVAPDRARALLACLDGLILDGILRGDRGVSTAVLDATLRQIGAADHGTLVADDHMVHRDPLK